MNDSLKTWGIGVATALAVSSLGMAGNTYVDVQVLKHNQQQLKEISDNQQETSKQIQQILSAMDKQYAVQSETVKALSETVNELKTVKGRKQ